MNKIAPETLINKREIEVLTYLAKGFSNKEIGELIGRSAFTIKDNVRDIFTKLGVSNRVEAAVQACKMGLPI